MKKLLYLLPMAALPLMFMQSCSPEQDDLFNDSAIERLEADAQSVLDLLCSSENGWEMLYFLNEEEDIPCYTLLVKFEKSGGDGVAQFASYSDITSNQYRISEKSPFTVKIDNSTVLSFDSYNSIFHVFSDPDYLGEKGPTDTDYPYDSGRGMMGDYEFNVVDHSSSDVVMLKGKKRGTYTVLRRLDADVDWQQYFTDLNATKNSMLTANPAPLRLVVGERYFHLYNGGGSIFEVVDGATDDGALTAAQDWKFVLFSDGLRFITGFDQDGVNAGQDFYYNADRTRLESSTGAYIDAGDPYWFFKTVNTADASTGNTVHNWVVEYDGMGATAKQLFDAVYASSFGQSYPNFQLIFAGLNGVGDILGLTGSNLVFSRYYNSLVKTADDNARTISYTLGETQSNMEAIYTVSNNAMRDVYSLFDGKTYRFETVQPFSMQRLRMVSVDDDELSFNVSYK